MSTNIKRKTMGKYINIGNAEFESVRKDEYVDKSMLIAYVNSVLGSQSKFLCVSRARRFTNDVHAVNSRDAVLTLLIHLGYLSYNDDKRTVRIPNYEVQQEFERTIQDGGNWGNLAKLLNQSEQLLADTLAGNADAVAAAIDLAHDSGTSILKYNDENSLACVLRLAYFSALKDFTMIRELPSGKGFADIVLLPNRNVDKPAVVLELKFNHSADTAIAQVKEHRYAGMLLDHVGSVLLVGINYDKKTKHHECLIERLDASIAQNDTQNDTQGAQNDTQGDTQGKLKGKALDAWILAQIRKNTKVSTERLAQLSGRGIATIKRHTAAMPTLRFQGSGYSGEWIIIEQ